MLLQKPPNPVLVPTGDVWIDNLLSKFVHYLPYMLCNFSFHQTHALLDKHGFIGWLYYHLILQKNRKVNQAHNNTCPSQLTHRTQCTIENPDWQGVGQDKWRNKLHFNAIHFQFHFYYLNTQQPHWIPQSCEIRFHAWPGDVGCDTKNRMYVQPLPPVAMCYRHSSYD